MHLNFKTLKDNCIFYKDKIIFQGLVSRFQVFYWQWHQISHNDLLELHMTKHEQ